MMKWTTVIVKGIRSRNEVLCSFYEDSLILVLTDAEFYTLQSTKPNRNICIDLTGICPIYLCKVYPSNLSYQKQLFAKLL